jgi:hypothetical protein
MISVAIAAVLTLTQAVPIAIASPAAAVAGPRLASGPGAPPARTAKERLVNKASDDQRVNNCKVPVALRGPKPRPDGCRPGVAGAPTPTP